MIDYVLLEFLFFCSDGVGRSTLIEQYCKSFPENYKTTLGFNIFVKHVKLKQGKEVTIRLWDPSERLFFKRFNQFIYRQANGGIIMYDITNTISLKKIADWCEEIRKLSGDIPIMLIGNKLDLIKKRAVSEEEVRNIIKKNNISSYMEVSLKTGENVDLAFEVLTKLILE